MKIVWSFEALQDRRDIWSYIASDHPRAANNMDKLFSESVLKLADYPYAGKQGMISGTRELIPHSSYRLIYEVRDEAVLILALVHTARLWPPIKK